MTIIHTSDRGSKSYERTVPCAVCSEAPDGNRYSSDTGDLCFTCHFWKEQKEHPHGLVVRAENGRLRHYRYGENNPEAPFKGFGGASFVVGHYDRQGSLILIGGQTNDMWMQGDVPEHLEHLFPVNAVFFRNEEEAKAAGIELILPVRGGAFPNAD